jgi:hypothetical protein
MAAGRKVYEQLLTGFGKSYYARYFFKALFITWDMSSSLGFTFGFASSNSGMNHVAKYPPIKLCLGPVFLVFLHMFFRPCMVLHVLFILQKNLLMFF